MFKHLSLALFYTIMPSLLFLNACSPPTPALMSGSDTWPLKTVTYPTSLRAPNGETVTAKDENLKIIRAEFECPENRSLSRLIMGGNDLALSNFSVYLPQGLSDVYITDGQENKYPVVLVEDCSISGFVPSDGTGFKLQFKDLEPVALDK